MNDPIFANGFIFKENEKAPDFVVGKLSMNVVEAKQFLDDYAKGGWVNTNIKQSKGGKFYIELDTWEPNQDAAKAIPVANAEVLSPGPVKDDLPF